MNYLLDTHVLLWYALAQKELPKEFEARIDEDIAEGTRIGLSVISIWEIAKLYERGRIRLQHSIDQFLRSIEEHPALVVLPINAFIAVDSTRLGKDFPKDPADQIIAATARHHLLHLMTADQQLRDANVVGVV